MVFRSVKDFYWGTEYSGAAQDGRVSSGAPGIAEVLTLSPNVRQRPRCVAEIRVATLQIHPPAVARIAHPLLLQNNWGYVGSKKVLSASSASSVLGNRHNSLRLRGLGDDAEMVLVRHVCVICVTPASFGLRRAVAIRADAGE